MRVSSNRKRKRYGMVSVEVVMATGLLTLIFGAIFALTKLILALYFDASYSVAQRPWL
jgi:hypothetical protein